MDEEWGEPETLFYTTNEVMTNDNWYLFIMNMITNLWYSETTNFRVVIIISCLSAEYKKNVKLVLQRTMINLFSTASLLVL